MEEAALLAAIAADPANADGWLVLADWLDERDDPRGELVRLCHALRARGLDKGPAREREEARVRELLRAGVRPCVPEIVNPLGMRFALVPAGSFHMGTEDSDPAARANEKPRHPVTLTRPFFLGVHLVTQVQWQAVTGQQPSAFRFGGERMHQLSGVTSTDNFPVDSVSHLDAVAFCERLSALEPGRRYRLPTEAEWEYAARAAGIDTGRYWWGREPETRFFNHLESSIGRPTPVGSYPPNALGLFDMAGNLWEPVADWYGDQRYYAESEPVNPTGPPGPRRTREGYRSQRGGSFAYSWFCGRSAHRANDHPDSAREVHGVRIALDLEGAV